MVEKCNEGQLYSHLVEDLLPLLRLMVLQTPESKLGDLDRRGILGRTINLMEEMKSICQLLCDVDWCVGYELPQDGHMKFDEARSRAYELLYGEKS